MCQSWLMTGLGTSLSWLRTCKTMSWSHLCSLVVFVPLCRRYGFYHTVSCSQRPRTSTAPHASWMLVLDTWPQKLIWLANKFSFLQQLKKIILTEVFLIWCECVNYIDFVEIMLNMPNHWHGALNCALVPFFSWASLEVQLSIISMTAETNTLFANLWTRKHAGFYEKPILCDLPLSLFILLYFPLSKSLLLVSLISAHLLLFAVSLFDKPWGKNMRRREKRRRRNHQHTLMSFHPSIFLLSLYHSIWHTCTHTYTLIHTHNPAHIGSIVL